MAVEPTEIKPVVDKDFWDELLKNLPVNTDTVLAGAKVEWNSDGCLVHLTVVADVETVSEIVVKHLVRS